MTETSGTDPVRWWCLDDWCAPVAEPVPGADWPGWEARYDNDCERAKRATRSPLGLPPRLHALLGELQDMPGEWSERLGYRVDFDPTLHGGGVHVTAPGGHLSTHVDYAAHPDGVSLRALNVIAFVHPRWRREWGGQLYLADPGGAAVRAFDPRPGRVVAFEVSDLALHGVRPTTADADERVSLAVYYLCGLATPRACDAVRHTRRRALFLPSRGDYGVGVHDRTL